MKASELITDLQNIIKEKGDLDVYFQENLSLSGLKTLDIKVEHWLGEEIIILY